MATWKSIALGLVAWLCAACGGGGGPPGPELHMVVPAAAFTPRQVPAGFWNDGSFVVATAPPGQSGSGFFVAPLRLPHGATLTRLTFHFDDSATNGSTSLTLWQSVPPAGGSGELAVLQSADTFGGLGSTSTSTFLGSPIIDLTQRAYFLVMMVTNTADARPVHGIGADVAYLPPPAASPSWLLLPPAAFFTTGDSGGYLNDGDRLTHSYGPGASLVNGTYVAPVHLPQGAVLDQLSLLWRRSATASIELEARLHRVPLGTEDLQTLASAASTPGVGSFAGEATVPVSPATTIDNAAYAYWVAVDVPPLGVSPMELRGVRLRYVPPAAGSTRTTLPAAAFHPSSDEYHFQNDGSAFHFTFDDASLTASGVFVAPVDLPQGATLQRMRFYWNEISVDPGVARLHRKRWGTVAQETLAEAASPGTVAGFGSTADDTVLGGPVDNAQYAYWVSITLPPDWIPGATLEVRPSAVAFEHTP